MGDNAIQPGLTGEAAQEVTPKLSAPHIGSGTMRVYATPAMVMLVEQTCASMVAPLLHEHQTTVGAEVQVRHLAPTPVGGQVRIRAEVIDVQANLVTFEAKVWDEVELVGEATHRRVVVDKDRFMRRVNAKSPKNISRPEDDRS